MREGDLQIREYFLMPGYIYLSSEHSLLSTVVGSSVAVSVWDEKTKFGGMCNYLYPAVHDQALATAVFGNAALNHLVGMFLEEGSQAKYLVAQIFGGANNEDAECTKVALNNIQIARKTLKRLKILVASEDVGGSMGRKVVYNTLRNEAIVYKVNNIRMSDWYPYISEGRES